MSVAFRIIIALLLVVGLFQACETLQQGAEPGNSVSSLNRNDLRVPGTDQLISSASVAGQFLQSGYSDCTRPESSIQCMVCNCFNEAGVHGQEGQILVSQTVLARVASIHYPNTICGVVWQRAQFSWTLSSIETQEVRGADLMECYRSSVAALERGPSRWCHYHTTGVSPNWMHLYRLAHRHRNHRFYSGGCGTQREEPGHEQQLATEGVEVYALINETLQNYICQAD